MCGLAGCFSFTGERPSSDYFTWCMQSMKHRGPDDQGMWTNNQNYLAAFVRLSIRDVSIRGHQPMLSQDAKYCLSFNGEIYNTTVLQDHLKVYDIHWVSSSDTEILLYALIYLGLEKTLDLIDGMFAFAFYNIEQDELVLARDRMGIKPLYLGINDKGVVYSSQYDHIINHAYFIDNPIDTGALGQYLQLGYSPPGNGIIGQTQLVPQGTYYRIKHKQVKYYKYYDFEQQAKKTSSDEIADILKTSVESQLVSDVPVGCFLSGGVDSSLVVWYAAQAHTKINCFTIGNTIDEFDESGNAKQIAETAGVNHHISFLSNEHALALTAKHIEAFSEPYADHSSLPILHLSAFAKENVKVALSGDGGDELFWGYSRSVKLLQQSSLYSSLGFVRKSLAAIYKLYYTNKVLGAGFWNQDNFDLLYYQRMFITGAYERVPLLFKKNVPWPETINALSARLHKKTSITELMQHARYIELYYHLQRILLKTDRSSMYSGLEVRVPYLSNAILQYAAALTHDQCINKNEGKDNLKKLLEQYMGPSFAYRKKRGFVVPIDNWLRTTLKSDVKEKILDMPSSLSIFFDKQRLEQYVKEYFTGKNNESWLIWSLYTLVLWNNMHVNKNIQANANFVRYK